MQMWIWRDGAFEPIVTAGLFEQARAIIESRHHHLSDQELLERLRELLRVQGRLSGILIDETEDMPSSSCYSSRFGSLTRAYSLIGWNPDRDYAYIEINRRLRRKHADLIASIFDQLLGLGATVSVNQYNDLLTINCEYTASLILAKCRETHAGNHRWHLRFDESLSPDIMLAARLQPGNEEILDYYLLPRLDVLTERLSLRPVDDGSEVFPLAMSPEAIARNDHPINAKYWTGRQIHQRLGANAGHLAMPTSQPWRQLWL